MSEHGREGESGMNDTCDYCKDTGAFDLCVYCKWTLCPKCISKHKCDPAEKAGGQ